MLSDCLPHTQSSSDPKVVPKLELETNLRSEDGFVWGKKSMLSKTALLYVYIEVCVDAQTEIQHSKIHRLARPC